jgi:hypothetical protein
MNNSRFSANKERYGQGWDYVSGPYSTRLPRPALALSLGVDTPMNTGLVVGIIVGVGYGVWALFNDKNLWLNKPREVLERTITGADWTKMRVALEEVEASRRGHTRL